MTYRPRNSTCTAKRSLGRDEDIWHILQDRPDLRDITSHFIDVLIGIDPFSHDFVIYESHSMQFWAYTYLVLSQEGQMQQDFQWLCTVTEIITAGQRALHIVLHARFCRYTVQCYHAEGLPASAASTNKLGDSAIQGLGGCI